MLNDGHFILDWTSRSGWFLSSFNSISIVVGGFSAKWIIGTWDTLHFILECIGLLIGTPAILRRFTVTPALIEGFNNINISINILITFTDFLQLIPHILINLLISTEQLIQSRHLLELSSLGGTPRRCGNLLLVCFQVGDCYRLWFHTFWAILFLAIYVIINEFIIGKYNTPNQQQRILCFLFDIYYIV